MVVMLCSGGGGGGSGGWERGGADEVQVKRLKNNNSTNKQGSHTLMKKKNPHCSSANRGFLPSSARPTTSRGAMEASQDLSEQMVSSTLVCARQCVHASVCGPLWIPCIGHQVQRNGCCVCVASIHKQQMSFGATETSTETSVSPQWGVSGLSLTSWDSRGPVISHQTRPEVANEPSVCSQPA